MQTDTGVILAPFSAFVLAPVFGGKSPAQDSVEAGGGRWRQAEAYPLDPLVHEGVSTRTDHVEVLEALANTLPGGRDRETDKTTSPFHTVLRHTTKTISADEDMSRVSFKNSFLFQGFYEGFKTWR